MCIFVSQVWTPDAGAKGHIDNASSFENQWKQFSCLGTRGSKFQQWEEQQQHCGIPRWVCRKYQRAPQHNLPKLSAIRCRHIRVCITCWSCVLKYSCDSKYLNPNMKPDLAGIWLQSREPRRCGQDGAITAGYHSSSGHNLLQKLSLSKAGTNFMRRGVTELQQFKLPCHAGIQL